MHQAGRDGKLEELIEALITKLTAAGIAAGRAGPGEWIPGDSGVYAMVGVDRWTLGESAVARVAVYGPRTEGCAACDAGAQAVAAALGEGAVVTGGVYDKETDCFRAEVTWTQAPEQTAKVLLAKYNGTSFSGLKKLEITETRDKPAKFALGVNQPVGRLNGSICWRITLTQENPTEVLPEDGFAMQVLMEESYFVFDDCAWERVDWQRTAEGQTRTAQAVAWSRTLLEVSTDAV